MSDGAKIVRGPWRPPASPQEQSVPAVASSPSTSLEDLSGRMHLAFVVRECAVALGHAPSPEELADWANHQSDERGEYCLFGRCITPAEARVILAHPGRAVTVRPERARARV